MKKIDFNDEYKQIYTDIWQIHKKYVNVDDPDGWEQLINDIDGFTRKYHSKFAAELAKTVINEIEIKCIERKKC